MLRPNLSHFTRAGAPLLRAAVLVLAIADLEERELHLVSVAIPPLKISRTVTLAVSASGMSSFRDWGPVRRRRSARRGDGVGGQYAIDASVDTPPQA